MHLADRDCEEIVEAEGHDRIDRRFLLNDLQRTFPDLRVTGRRRTFHFAISLQRMKKTCEIQDSRFHSRRNDSLHCNFQRVTFDEHDNNDL